MRAYPAEVRPYFEWLVEVGRVLGLNPTVTSTVRTEAEQAVLYRAYLAGRSRYPVAPPGRSDHQAGRAIDISCRNPAELARYWQAIGGRWSPTDAVHFYF